ncbi:HIRAN domain-containing protein [Plantactinospora sp. BB1]|uniref:HIRAN domain-containing protein n=1 Tax=Plantactinospora sp. BB1 TaxID=2071627 RepID=UPI000D157AFF|nr:HIRAN domain-containing protein [Plantactinospora sp. BB1]
MSIPFDLWGQRGWASTEVAGESHYTKAIRGMFGRDFKPTGTEINVPVQLIPEPKNRHDRNAVGVWSGRNQIGYLPRVEAARYVSVLSALTAEGWLPQVSARVWGSEWSDFDDRRSSFQGSVRLDLAEPHMLVPANMPPNGEHRVLPLGGAIQVTGEEKHLDALAPLLRPEGECWVFVTLHELMEQLARSSRPVVEVRIDERRVGQLTPKMSGELLPAIRHLAAVGTTTAARAIVKGNRIKAEVVLYVVRAHELPETWLGTTAASPAGTPKSPATIDHVSPVPDLVAVVLQAHGVIPPRPTGIEFAVPPSWPPAPKGWTPPPGWCPDPSWPPAPAGWQWWVPVWD